MFIVAAAMKPSSERLKSSDRLSACSHHDDISGSAVAMLWWLLIRIFCDLGHTIPAAVRV